MATLNDEMLRATGGPTVNDGLSVWYSRTPDESLPDAELRWLQSQPGVNATFNGDAWRQHLSNLGYPGDLPDQFLAYWSAQP